MVSWHLATACRVTHEEQEQYHADDPDGNENQRYAPGHGLGGDALLEHIDAVVFFVTRLTVNAASSANVVVLTPPPQEPGDAPKNMRKIIMASVASFKEAISTVLNPAVRHVMD